jgi:hypothetical protein
MRIILEDDFAVLSGSLPGAGAIVVPFWELAHTGDWAFHRLLQNTTVRNISWQYGHGSVTANYKSWYRS